MFKFFAALRALLALDRSHQSLGAVVHDAIERIIIPRLKKMAKASRNPEKYDALISEYREYSDPTNSKSRVFADYAEEIVEAFARRYNKGAGDAETVAQDIATSFYTRPTWMGSFEVPHFNPETGPIGLVKYWRHILNNQAMYAFRALIRKSPYDEPREGEDPFSNIPAPDVEKEEKEAEDIKQELHDYIESNVKSMGKKGKFLMDVFRKWMGAVSEVGTWVSVDKHVIKPIMIEYERMGEPVSSQTVYNAVHTLKSMSERFMHKLRAGSVKAKLGSIDALVYEEFRKRLASWVLGK